MGLPPNGFQDRLVMTTSITLRVRLLSFRFANFLEKVLEGIIFCTTRRAKTSGVSRLFGTLQKSATANFQDRLVMTASISLHVNINTDLYNISHYDQKVKKKIKNIYIFFEKGIAFRKSLCYNSHTIDLWVIYAQL